MRKSIQQDVLGTHFPQLCQEDPEEPETGSPWGRRPPRRKMLPDRSRAARDRANQKLVEFIVRARGAEGHLRDILGNRKPSRWLKTFLKSGQYVTCVETYLEDEEQLDRVVKYLQGLCQDAGSRALARSSGDRIRFILDVLLPEVRAPRPGLQGGPPGDEPRASPACAHVTVVDAAWHVPAGSGRAGSRCSCGSWRTQWGLQSRHAVCPDTVRLRCAQCDQTLSDSSVHRVSGASRPRRACHLVSADLLCGGP